MSEYLFVYGTLLPGSAPDEIAETARQLRPVGEGSVRGHLYDLGHYPGAVLDPACEGRVFGTVFALSEDSATRNALLNALDEYEEFDPVTPARSQFLRTRTQAVLPGGVLECWIYVYNQNLEGARAIGNGRWRSP